jgi:hypothetical protein
MEYMEENDQQEELGQDEQLVITEDIRSYIYESARWTKFLAVVGFVLSAFTVIGAFGAGAFLDQMATLQPGNPLLQLGPGFITVLFLAVALLYFYPSLLLFSYSSAAKAAVLYANQEGLNIAMSKLKAFFKFWGILMMVLISFYVVLILFGTLLTAGMQS